MRKHRNPACERADVLRAVSKHINLSTTEWETFLVQDEGGCLACNCGRGLWNLRSTATLERLVIDAVLQARGLRARQALTNAQVAENMKDWRLDGFEKEGQLIRIDFKNRRRII